METETQSVAPTPETDEDPIPPTPPVVLVKGRKKISKTVKKTFMDDDGFMGKFDLYYYFFNVSHLLVNKHKYFIFSFSF